MKKLLTLLALAGLSTAVACGDDSGSEEDNGKDETTDGKGKTDAAVKDSSTPRDQQIDTDSLGSACTKNTDCKGSGNLQCVTNLGGMIQLEGGYCTAQCTADSECGTMGKCPVAALAANPLIGGIIGNLNIIPSNCFKTCDAKVANSCGREGFECRSLLEGLNNPNIPMIPGFDAASIAAMFPGLEQTYCVPPAPEFDGGFPFPLPDGGARAIKVNGLDAGL